MKLIDDDVQAEYRRQVHRFAEEVLRPIAEERYDFTKPLGRDDLAAIRDELSGHDIATSPPVRDDGTLERICLAIFVEEVSRIDINFALLATPLFFPLWNMANLLNERQEELYGHMFQPGAFVSMGLSEPNAGSNPAQIETKVTRVDDGWLINGRKLWTSHATVTSGVLVACRRDEADGGGIALFLVDREAQSYDVRVIPCLGMNAVSTCEVTFEDCWVPPEAELTPGGDGLRAALNLVEQARFDLIFIAVGVARAAFELATAYAKDRTQFERPIGGFQLIQGLLATMATEIEAARLLGYRAVSVVEAGGDGRTEISMAKSYATEMAVRVTSMGIQVHGGIGLTKECDAERYFRDARMLTIPDGATQIHQLVIGRALTGISAFT